MCISTIRRVMVLGLVLLAAASCRTVPGLRTAEAGPKYVFLFIGDGMGSAQIQAAEAYLTVTHGGSARNPADLRAAPNRLALCKLPVHGMQTTYDDGALMTDSASAATAFACGATETLRNIMVRCQANGEGGRGATIRPPECI